MTKAGALTGDALSVGSRGKNRISTGVLEGTERSDPRAAEGPLVEERRPLTERILARLPGPRVAWVAAWALVPWLNLAALLTLQGTGRPAMEGGPARQVFLGAAFSYAIILSLWGSRKISREVEVVMPRLSRMLSPGSADPAGLFRGVGSTAAPLLLTAGGTVLFATRTFLEQGWVAAIPAGIASVLIGGVNWTFFWVYLSLQVGLDRLGRRNLELDPDAEDRDLGLRPVGRLAFAAFWILIAGITPLALVTTQDPVGLTVIFLVLGAGVAAFFVSLRRLNRQMVAVKRRQLAWARGLYWEAVAPVKAHGTLEAVGRQAGLLSAAETLHKRAERIQEWPFDEGTFARVVAIASTVTAAVLARLMLAPFGI